MAKKPKAPKAVTIIARGGGGSNQNYTAAAANKLVPGATVSKAAGGHTGKKPTKRGKRL